jgi:hypothetical protein
MEGREHLVAVLGGDARPVVDHRHLHSGGGRAHGHRDGRAGRGVPQRVGDEVGHRALEQHRVGTIRTVSRHRA